MNDQVDTVNTESLPSANISDMNAKKSRRGRPAKLALGLDENQPEQKTETKFSKADLYSAVTAAIQRSPLQILPSPDFNIQLVELEGGMVTPVIIAPNEVCKRISLVEIRKLIMKYAQKLAAFPGYKFTAADCRDCADYWEYATEPLKNIRHVRFGDDPGLCWNRVPFEIKSGSTPHFDEMFSRMQNATAVKAWIGSLFIPESFRQQYVWIYGGGNDGKSSLLEFLAKVFGAEGSLSQSIAPKGDHWGEHYPGKRLIFFPDFKDYSSLDTGPLKQITGGDRIYINPKYKSAYMAELMCKLIFSSNHMPSIEIQISNLRRLIFAEMQTTKKYDPDYPKYLWEEGGAFLKECIEAYHNLCPNHNPIPVSEESVESLKCWASRKDDPYELFFEDYLKPAPGAFLRATELQKVIRFRFNTRSEENKAYEWLRDRGYKRVKACNGDVRVFGYKNLAVKQFNSEI